MTQMMAFQSGQSAVFYWRTVAVAPGTARLWNDSPCPITRGNLGGVDALVVAWRLAPNAPTKSSKSPVWVAVSVCLEVSSTIDGKVRAFHLRGG